MMHQRRFTKEFEVEAVRQVQTAGEASVRSSHIGRTTARGATASFGGGSSSGRAALVPFPTSHSSSQRRRLGGRWGIARNGVFLSLSKCLSLRRRTSRGSFKVGPGVQIRFPPGEGHLMTVFRLLRSRGRWFGKIRRVRWLIVTSPLIPLPAFCSSVLGGRAKDRVILL